jgi:hypothetical protein
MNQEHQELHDRLDALREEIAKQIPINPQKAKGLIRHFTDLVSYNFKQTIKHIKP